MQQASVIGQSQLRDEEIIERIKEGEKSLYELIVRRYNPRLFRISMAIVKDENEAEENMQAAYVKAYEKLAQFQGKSSFATWLTRILINESLMSLKRSERNYLVNDDSEPEQTVLLNMTRIENKTPEHEVLNNELRIVLENAVMNLPEKYRMVYMMREVEKLSVEETGSLLDITHSNVKVILNRAKSMLRKNISEQYEETEVFAFHLNRCDRIVDHVMSRI